MNIFFSVKDPSYSHSAYTRSGPTYDQQSLRSTDDDDSEYDRRAPPQAAAAVAWHFPPQSSQPSQPPGLSMGRGRGRGRGVQSTQPLRRPNLPGMAPGAAAAVASQGEM